MEFMIVQMKQPMFSFLNNVHMKVSKTCACKSIIIYINR